MHRHHDMASWLMPAFYPMAVMASLLALGIGPRLGFQAEAALLAFNVALLATLAWLERRQPFRQAWQVSHGDTATDLSSMAVLLGLIEPFLKMALPIWGASLMAQPTTDATPWMPFWFHVTMALLWIDFAKYWVHRAHHRWPALWWLHALHHGSRRLYWLNNFRIHPLNHVLNTLFSLLPLYCLNVSTEVILTALAVLQPIVLMQHANVDFKSRWLNGLISTNGLHRWHHSAHITEGDNNFGSGLSIWDQLFGTYLDPADRAAPASVGLFDDGQRYPAHRSFLHQTLSMFGPSCCRT